MVRKFTETFLDYAAKLISEGVGLSKVAVKLGCNADNLSKELRARGVIIKRVLPPAHNTINHLNESAIVEEYINGGSTKEIAAKNKVSRNVITRIIRKNCITERNRSESMFVRMSKTSAEERQRISKNAHDAVRGMTRSVAQGIKTAKTCEVNGSARGAMFGPGENELYNKLVEAGYLVTRQKAFNVYSVDLVFGSVCVEVKFGASCGLRSNRFTKRIEHTFKAGYTLAVVAIHDNTALVEGLDQIVTLLNFVSCQPPAPCQYWVIKCGLQTSPVARFNRNNLTGKTPPPELVTSIRKIHF